MDRLLSKTGGQPLRSDDWKFIQDKICDVIGQLIDGLKGSSSSCIISGCEITKNFETGKISVANGYLFYNGEIYYVSGGTFDLVEGISDGSSANESHGVFFESAFTETESRTFKDNTVKAVYQLRTYETRYTDVPEQGWIPYPDTLQDILSDNIISRIPAPPSEVVVKRTTTAINASNFDQYIPIIPAPGTGRIIKVLGISAKIDVQVPLNVDDQDLKVFYGSDPQVAPIGSFPNEFLEIVADTFWDMEKIDGKMAENQPVSVKLSDASYPSSGSATIRFYCTYVIFTA